MKFSPTYSLLSWRDKLKRALTMKPLQERGENLLRNLPFYLDARTRQVRYEQFKKCKSVEDYHQFISASPRIAPHQIRSEIIGFIEYARLQSPVNVCEIGTAQGGTNFMLSQSLPTVNFMLGIDLYVRNKSSLRYFSRQEQEIHYWNRSSYESMTIEETRQVLQGRKLDLLFIDGDHTYDGVRKDFFSYKDFVEEGGLIAFHDIIPDYKTRYNRDTGRWAGDVPKFWDKIKMHFENCEFVENYEQDALGIGCIRYSSNIHLPADL